MEGNKSPLDDFRSMSPLFATEAIIAEDTTASMLGTCDTQQNGA